MSKCEVDILLALPLFLDRTHHHVRFDGESSLSVVPCFHAMEQTERWTSALSRLEINDLWLLCSSPRHSDFKWPVQRYCAIMDGVNTTLTSMFTPELFKNTSEPQGLCHCWERCLFSKSIAPQARLFLNCASYTLKNNAQESRCLNLGCERGLKSLSLCSSAVLLAWWSAWITSVCSAPSNGNEACSVSGTCLACERWTAPRRQRCERSCRWPLREVVPWTPPSPPQPASAR